MVSLYYSERQKYDQNSEKQKKSRYTLEKNDVETLLLVLRKT